MTRRLLGLACAMAIAAVGCGDPEGDPAGAAPADTAAAVGTPLPLPEEPTVTDERTEPPMRQMPGTGEALVRCDPDAARSAIGQEATAEVVEQARVAAGADVARTLSPGQMVTMEFHNSRLNLSVDAHDVVVDVSCG